MCACAGAEPLNACSSMLYSVWQQFVSLHARSKSHNFPGTLDRVQYFGVTVSDQEPDCLGTDINSSVAFHDSFTEIL
jgi:hypothetical protein